MFRKITESAGSSGKQDRMSKPTGCASQSWARTWLQCFVTAIRLASEQDLIFPQLLCSEYASIEGAAAGK